MKIILVADGRSPITKRWIESVRRLKTEVILVSTYHCEPVKDIDGFYCLPVAFAKYAGSQASSRTSSESPNPPKKKGGLIKRFRPLFMRLRYIIGPMTVWWYGLKFRIIVKKERPNLVHALRIPFEGMMAAWTPKQVPFAVSIWGNDLTLHASGSPLMKRMTRKTLERANGLCSDANRDVRLAKIWGFDNEKPTCVVPGNGGISQPAIKISAELAAEKLLWLPRGHTFVINPRGFRTGSVRSDTFFQCIPLVISQRPDAFFLCCSMAGQPEAQEWIDRLKIWDVVMLLPTITQQELWGLFTKAKVTVTVSEHDGTPNSLLEAMTCGCFPIGGDIESMREWITPGANGMLVNPDDPTQLAAAIVSALSNETLRENAAALNMKIIEERAEISSVSTAIGVFYQQLSD